MSSNLFGSPPDIHSFPTRRSSDLGREVVVDRGVAHAELHGDVVVAEGVVAAALEQVLGRVEDLLAGVATEDLDRKSTRLNSSHVEISYAVFCLKKKRSFYGRGSDI